MPRFSLDHPIDLPMEKGHCLGGNDLMTDCLECQRLRRELKQVRMANQRWQLEYLAEVQKRIDLKRFMVDQDIKSVEAKRANQVYDPNSKP